MKKLAANFSKRHTGDGGDAAGDGSVDGGDDGGDDGGGGVDDAGDGGIHFDEGDCVEGLSKGNKGSICFCVTSPEFFDVIRSKVFLTNSIILAFGVVFVKLCHGSFQSFRAF